MAALGWGRLKPKLQCRLMYTSAHNCALAHSSYRVCVGPCKSGLSALAGRYIKDAQWEWRMNVIPSQRSEGLPDINVGNLLHQRKKYLIAWSCSVEKKTVLFLKRTKKLNACMTRHTALLRSSVLSSSRLPLPNTTSVSQGSRCAFTQSPNVIGA